MPKICSLTSNYLENMYHNSFYGKKFLGYGRASFGLWPTAALLNFQIQLVSLNISFSMVPGAFIPKGTIAS